MLNSVWTDNISIIVNLIVFLLTIIFSFILINKLKIEQKNYKVLFILYLFFWIPLMLLRSYTGTMESKALNDNVLLWLPLSAYGFIGIFARIFADWFCYLRKNRKSFIYLAIIIQIITYIPIIIYPCTTTNVIQSLGVGVGASCIGTYQMLFNEQYGKSKCFLTISILSIPPLLADFISSPIQSVVSVISKTQSEAYDKNILKYLWLIGLVFVLISLVLCFFVKEEPSNFLSDVKYKSKLKSHNEVFYFILICVLGSIIAFIKFANSGSIAQLHLQKLSDNTSQAYEGYLSVMFSFGQLVGGLITGLYLINKIGKVWSFSIGIIVWIIYHIISLFVTNPYAYLGVHILNGFAYGIVYNLILGFILQKTFTTNKITPTGIYQSILSVGITASTWFTSYLKQDVLGPESSIEQYMKVSELINLIIIGFVIFSLFLFLYTVVLEKRDFKYLLWKKRR